MKYCTTGFMANPESGMLTPGEILSERQMKMLGRDVIESLVKRGALMELNVEELLKVAETTEPEELKEEEPKKPEAATEERPKSAGAKGKAGEAEPEEGEELPELEISADMVGEETPKKKTGGRRKS